MNTTTTPSIKPEWRVPPALLVLPTTPFNDYPFYQYLLVIEKECRPDNFLESMIAFVTAHGFNKSTTDLPPSFVKTCRDCWTMYHRYWTAIREPVPFSQLFVEVDFGGFYVQPLKKRYQATEALLALCADRGLVYDPITPAQYYFSFNDRGLLWIKYQTLIGHRPICPVDLDTIPE